jgi:hypothetical protein
MSTLGTTKIISVFILILLALSSFIFAQQSDTSSFPKLSIGIEIRPRVEFRSNHIQPPRDTMAPYLFATQRNRVSIFYLPRKKWKVAAELQEIHHWDQQHITSRIGGVNFYQLYFEYRKNSVKLRLGRQGVLLDNGRLFSDAPWAQQGRAHEGIRLTEYTQKHTQDLFLLFTRPYGHLFDPVYSPVASHKYKYLLVYHFHYHPGQYFFFNTIHSFEFFERLRATSGGRMEFKNDFFYATVNSYVQLGQTPDGKNVYAYYIQPEIKITVAAHSIRVGAEIMSGSHQQLSANQTGSFDNRYGVVWKFMGNMNLFSRFPDDLGDRGLLNPYLFLQWPVARKITVRSDLHLFYAQYSLADAQVLSSGKFLGFEQDLSFRYSIQKKLELNGGFSYFLSSPTMAFLPKIQDPYKIATWSYLMFSYKINVRAYPSKKKS